MASYAEQYYNPPGMHPSLPNYLWLEAGRAFGIRDDNEPAVNHQSTTKHLVIVVGSAGVSWKSYQQGIDGSECPLTSDGLYAPKHNPMVYFDDVTDTNNRHAAGCIAHVRGIDELAQDLPHDTVARYNFITPDLCGDMHNSEGCDSTDAVKNGDEWLAQMMPQILASPAYLHGGAVFITWDENAGGSAPIGMIVVSDHAKGGGYANTIPYTHSSTLRTIQEIFGVTPLLGDAANATNLQDLFQAPTIER